jgi:hypothetical protein
MAPVIVIEGPCQREFQSHLSPGSGQCRAHHIISVSREVHSTHKPHLKHVHHAEVGPTHKAGVRDYSFVQDLRRLAASRLVIVVAMPLPVNRDYALIDDGTGYGWS